MKKLLTLFAALLATSTLAVAGEYEDISIEELSKAIAEGKVTVLDVNGTGSFERNHIPGAIDFRANKDQIATLLPADKEQLVVAYCGGPGCNAYKAGAKAAEDLGYKNVKHLSAGINGWLDAGKPVEKKG
jgi:rhodanese-related sulfurtransferase